MTNTYLKTSRLRRQVGLIYNVKQNVIPGWGGKVIFGVKDLGIR